MIAPSTPSRRGFTLIELLVVISIIGILMTLLFPAAQSAIDAARKTQAKNDAVQIAIAVTGYVSEYGKNPPGDPDNANSDALMDVLCPPDPNNPPADNPRGIVFLEVPNAKNKKNGRQDQKGPYLDPWSNAYQIKIDDNYDSIIQGPDGEDIRKSVIVWSMGKNGATDTAGSTRKDDARSWE